MQSNNQFKGMACWLMKIEDFALNHFWVEAIWNLAGNKIATVENFENADIRAYVYY